MERPFLIQLIVLYVINNIIIISCKRLDSHQYNELIETKQLN